MKGEPGDSTSFANIDNPTPSSRATQVPVGEDQKQHLEFARECATNFNAAYGQHLVPPKTIICE